MIFSTRIQPKPSINILIIFSETKINIFLNDKKFKVYKYVYWCVCAYDISHESEVFV